MNQRNVKSPTEPPGLREKAAALDELFELIARFVARRHLREHSAMPGSDHAQNSVLAATRSRRRRKPTKSISQRLESSRAGGL